MHVIYFHQYFNTPSMPGSTRSYEFAKRLVNEGHQVTMITSCQDSLQRKNLKFSDEDGIKVYWLPVLYSNKMTFIRRIISFFHFSFLAYVKASQIKGDLVFATSTPLTIAIPAVMVKKKHRIPMVFEVRDLWPELPIAVGALKSRITIIGARWLERWAYQSAVRIIALSPGMRDGIVKQGVPREKVSVVTNLSNVTQFNVPKRTGDDYRKRFSWMDGNPLVLYAGAIGIVNGLEYLVKIASIMVTLHSNIRFLIVGKGIEKVNLMKKAEAMGVLGKNLFFLNPIPKSEIPALYSAATVVTSLFIDLNELQYNSANKFFDGLAAGKPVVINYGGWQKKLLVKYNAGLALPYTDYMAASKDLAQLLTDERRLAEMGENARRLAMEKFNIETQYRKFSSVLENAVSVGCR